MTRLGSAPDVHARSGEERRSTLDAETLRERPPRALPVELLATVLAAIVEAGERPTAAVLSETLGIPRPTTRRLLHVLERHALVAKTADSRYAAGAVLLRLRRDVAQDTLLARPRRGR
jgi:hypothetical protein